MNKDRYDVELEILSASFEPPGYLRLIIYPCVFYRVNFGEYAHDQFSFGKPGANGTDDEGPALSKLGSNSTAELWPKVGVEDDARPTSMPPASVMTRLILIMVWRKLVRIPNTYYSLIGLTCSLISLRWHIEMPAIVAGSIAILYNAGLGMALFSLGLFMTLQPRIIACGNSVASFAMAVRFMPGPAVGHGKTYSWLEICWYKQGCSMVF
ncbi:hypothetical protein Droror1_Dr00014665 [Drosera rotundifolia]